MARKHKACTTWSAPSSGDDAACDGGGVGGDDDGSSDGGGGDSDDDGDGDGADGDDSTGLTVLILPPT